MKFSTKLKTVGLIILLTFAAYRCSNIQETSSVTNSYQDSIADQSLTFKEDGSNWRVDFDKGDISAIYRNGKRIPKENHPQYEDMIYTKVSSLRRDVKKYKSDMTTFKLDMEKFKEDLKEMRKNLSENLPGKIEIEIDREEFKKGMEEMKEALKELKTQNFKLDFDKEAFGEEMKKLKEELKNIDFDNIRVEINKNMDDFNKEIEKVKISVKDLNIDLSGLDDNLKELDIEMKKLDAFIKELKDELISDGYLKSKDEKMNLIFNEKLIEVNGKVLSHEHHKKYLELYEKHFEKEIKGDFKINIRK